MLSCSIWFSAPSFWMGGGLESRSVGRVYVADGAVHHPQRKHDPRCDNGPILGDGTVPVWAVLPKFEGVWGGFHCFHPQRKHDLRSGSQDHHPSKNSVQKTIRCNSTSNAPDDGRMYPKHVELRIHQ